MEFLVLAYDGKDPEAPGRRLAAREAHLEGVHVRVWVLVAVGVRLDHDVSNVRFTDVERFAVCLGVTREQAREGEGVDGALGFVVRRTCQVVSTFHGIAKLAGVDTCKELRNRNPQSLLAKMTQINSSKRLVRRLPTEVMVK